MSYFPNTVTKFDPSNMSAFGTLEASELTPVFQGDFVYGLNTQIWSPAVVSGTGAAVGTSSGRLSVQSGTSASNYAYVTSRKIIRYRAGQGVTARFSPLFATSAASSTQLWGCGSMASNAPYDGYFFGYNGTALGVVRYASGTPTWVAQAAFNGDKVDGSTGSSFNWNPALGTPAMIKYPYLGYGDIQFFLQNPSDGRWVLVHVIQYANSSASTQISNPSLQFLGYAANTSNTTNLTMYCGSVGIFASGPRQFASNPRWAADRSVTIANGSETLIMNLKNASSYNGVTNRGLIRLNSISLASSVINQTAVVKFYIGTAPGGSPSFTAINGTLAAAGDTITSGNSVASVDVAGTKVATGANYVFNISFSGSGEQIDLSQYEIYIAPGEVLSVTGTGSGSMASNVSLNWSEDT